MSEVLQRFLPPIGGGAPVSATTQRLRRLRALAGDIGAQFVALVALPTACAALYFGFCAAPQFVSHTEYIVRGVDSHRSSGLTSLLNTFGISRAADETSAIESFLKSREVLEKLDARVNLRAVYGAAAADRFARFPRMWERDSFESLYTYTRNFISVSKDPASGVTKLDVAAFDPASAERTARVLLDLASDMANSLNARAQADTIAASKRARLARSGRAGRQRSQGLIATPKRCLRLASEETTGCLSLA